MKPHLEDINYPEGGTEAKLIYKTMINDDENFLPIMGKNERRITPTENGYAVTGQSASLPLFNSNHYLFIEDGKPKGFFAIKEDRVDYARREILNVHLLYVDKKYQRHGVAKRILQRLKYHADELDQMCKRRASYFTRVINERYFSLSVFPNLFDWYEGKELDLQEFIDGDPIFDFTVEAHDEDHLQDNQGYYPADLYMFDNTYGDESNQHRISQKKLRAFYESQGFVQCDELQFINPIVDGEVKREVNVSSHTLCNMNKTPLIYPDNRSFIEVVTDTMRPYFHKPITGEMGKVFARDVAEALDDALINHHQ
jgi:GNAT superfamily N-acetyltransferase